MNIFFQRTATPVRWQPADVLSSTLWSLFMRRILLFVATLVLTTGCDNESSQGKTNPPAAPGQPPGSEPSPAAREAHAPVPDTPTLRTAIVGKWVESKFGGGQGGSMSFTKDGRYQGFAVSTNYTGTYRVLDEHTIELNVASVLSDLRLVKKTLKVEWRNDLLTITSDSLKPTYVKQK